MGEGGDLYSQAIGQFRMMPRRKIFTIPSSYVDRQMLVELLEVLHPECDPKVELQHDRWKYTAPVRLRPVSKSSRDFQGIDR